MFGPVIVGERVRLAPIQKVHAENFVPWLADPDVIRWLGATSCPTLEMEHEWYERISKSEKDYLWGIFVGEKHIGCTGIHQIDWRNRNAITGNLIGDKTEWGKGYGSEVVALRTKYAFEMLGLEKLKTEAFIENVASRRALEKAGYKTMGIARREIFRHGAWQDLWHAELLRDEWEVVPEYPGS